MNIKEHERQQTPVALMKWKCAGTFIRFKEGFSLSSSRCVSVSFLFACRTKEEKKRNRNGKFITVSQFVCGTMWWEFLCAISIGIAKNNNSTQLNIYWLKWEKRITMSSDCVFHEHVDVCLSLSLSVCIFVMFTNEKPHHDTLIRHFLSLHSPS